MFRILWTGAQWSESPRWYGNASTCWRGLRPWEESGVLLTLWRAFMAQLNDRQKLRWDEGVVDGRSGPANKGGPTVGPTMRGKGTQWMVQVDGAGPPVGVYVDAASPAAVTERTFARLGHFRRLVVRYERLLTTSAGSSVSPVPSSHNGEF